MAALFHEPIFATVTASGDKLFFYQTGTTTDLTVYSDSALTTPHAQPVVADSNGEFPAIYIDTTGTTPKIVLKNSDESTTKWTVDPFPIDDLTTVSADLDTAEADIDSLEGRMDTAEADIDVLETESADYESRITTLEGVTNLQESDFTGTNQTLSSTGHQEFPGGLIINWGSASVGAGSGSTVTFDKAFPNAFLQATATQATNITKTGNITISSESTTGMTLTNHTDATVTIRYIAIGH